MSPLANAFASMSAPSNHACDNSCQPCVLPLLNHQHKVELFFGGLWARGTGFPILHKVANRVRPRLRITVNVGEDSADLARLKIAAPIAEWLNGFVHIPSDKFIRGHVVNFIQKFVEQDR